eukprot:scaffold3616_cov124-Isochrysis_galbana.AAC.10
MAPEPKVRTAVTATPTAAATLSEAEVARIIGSLNVPGSVSLEAAATSDVVAGERKLNALATRLKMLIPMPTPESSTAPQHRPTNAVSTRDATGSIPNPMSAGAAIATISLLMPFAVSRVILAGSEPVLPAHARATQRRAERWSRVVLAGAAAGQDTKARAPSAPLLGVRERSSRRLVRICADRHTFDYWRLKHEPQNHWNAQARFVVSINIFLVLQSPVLAQAHTGATENQLAARR